MQKYYKHRLLIHTAAWIKIVLSLLDYWAYGVSCNFQCVFQIAICSDFFKEFEMNAAEISEASSLSGLRCRLL